MPISNQVNQVLSFWQQAQAGSHYSYHPRIEDFYPKGGLVERPSPLKHRVIDRPQILHPKVSIEVDENRDEQQAAHVFQFQISLLNSCIHKSSQNSLL